MLCADSFQGRESWILPWKYYLVCFEEVGLVQRGPYPLQSLQVLPLETKRPQLVMLIRTTGSTKLTGYETLRRTAYTSAHKYSKNSDIALYSSQTV